MISETVVQRWYAGPQYDHTAQFFGWIRAASTAGSRVLNVGAGPGNGDPRCTLKGEVAELVGSDIDPEVMRNPEIDRGQITDGVTLPFADASFDFAYSDYVVEHVEHPVPFLAEVHRVLKPGGSYFFRTPNMYHYVAIASRFSPHKVHTAIANRMRNLPDDTHEPWKTYYRLNTRRQVARAAREVGFSGIDVRMVEGFPAYLRFHIVPFMAGVAYERLVNKSEILAGLRGNIFARLSR